MNNQTFFVPKSYFETLIFNDVLNFEKNIYLPAAHKVNFIAPCGKTIVCCATREKNLFFDCEV